MSPVQEKDREAVSAVISMSTRPPFDLVHRRWLQKELEIQLRVMRGLTFAIETQLVYLEKVVEKFSPACVARMIKKRYIPMCIVYHQRRGLIRFASQSCMNVCVYVCMRVCVYACMRVVYACVCVCMYA